ncbi:pyridoxal phosphate-dependent aminotransferase [Paenisporosarcina indica]|uniref:pyridoxal phosphate-dependent aminotransferase n=1 Tax=Paenisporosarcina indica TaxID=650093 RepID=UPI00094FBADC|nr:histidinol-phosphate transaminase [Paenisporosarcina indica]
MSLPSHGANPHHLYKNLGLTAPARIIDFSENVNPLGPPESIQLAWKDFQKSMRLYPDPLGEPFRTNVAKYHNISQDSVFVGNGAAEIFSLLAERFRGKRAILVHPTFSEYEATLKVRNVDIVNVFMKKISTGELPVDELKNQMNHADVLYLCTPNNPTGTLPKRSVINDLIAHAWISNCELVLDEAFIDFISEESSFISSLLAPHVIVVRSMTKMYAMPGLRLGYMVAAPSIVQELQQLAPHWNVNGIAAEVGSLVLKEEAYRQKTIHHSVKMRRNLSLFLTDHGCEVTQSQANFLLFKLQHTHPDFFQSLLRKGIVLRHTMNFHGLNGHWYRIGMKTEVEMGILKKELKVWFAEH